MGRSEVVLPEAAPLSSSSAAPRSPPPPPPPPVNTLATLSGAILVYPSALGEQSSRVAGERATAVAETWAAADNVGPLRVFFLLDHPSPAFMNVTSSPTHTVLSPPATHNATPAARLSWAVGAIDEALPSLGFLLKVDDVTYVRTFFLLTLTPWARSRELLFYGLPLQVPGMEVPFASGGAGYLLSGEAVRRGLVGCTSREAAEDLWTARCLGAAGTRVIDLDDEEGRPRFLAFGPGTMLEKGPAVYPTPSDWFINYRRPFGGVRTGTVDCCAPDLITLHYILPDEMRSLHYVLNDMQTDESMRSAAGADEETWPANEAPFYAGRNADLVRSFLLDHLAIDGGEHHALQLLGRTL